MITSSFREENETAKILVRLIESQLNLKDQGRVVIWNQKWNIPEDEGLYVVVRFLWSKPFGSSRTYSPDSEPVLSEILGVNVRERYAIELLSRGSAARIYLPEGQFIFSSMESVQAQELHHMKFGDLSEGFRDTSYVDGAARINRFSVEFNILRAYERIREVAFYDKFTIPPDLHINP